ncbi:hypothetical protein SNF32_07380 [Enterococcus mundtii]|nr:hypothetical protein [Enterococcus mundtii]
MAKVEIQNDRLIISMEGVRKLWALKNEISTPLSNVLGATVDADVWEDTPKFGEKEWELMPMDIILPEHSSKIQTRYFMTSKEKKTQSLSH